jgi:hypothetical protein
MADNDALDRTIRATLRRLHEAAEWPGRLQTICDRMALLDQTAAKPPGEASKQPKSHASRH